MEPSITYMLVLVLVMVIYVYGGSSYQSIISILTHETGALGLTSRPFGREDCSTPTHTHSLSHFVFWRVCVCYVMRKGRSIAWWWQGAREEARGYLISTNTLIPYIHYYYIHTCVHSIDTAIDTTIYTCMHTIHPSISYLACIHTYITYYGSYFEGSTGWYSWRFWC